MKSAKCPGCGTMYTKHEIFCKKCGKATPALSNELSAKETIKESWQQFKKRKAKNYPILIFTIIIALAPILYLKVYPLDVNHYLSYLKYLVFLPFLITPFFSKNFFGDEDLSKNNFFSNFKYYPRAFVFVLVNFIYFFLLKLICSGEPLIYYSYDPILNLVYVVMMLYWFAVIIPSFGLMKDKEDMNVFKVIYQSYKAGKETRWQQFFIFFFILILILLSFVTLGLGFLVTIPLSYIILENYYSRMKDFKLFD